MQSNAGNLISVTVTLLLVLVGLFGQSMSFAEPRSRPQNLTLESFQFGPVNRWAFSHMREVIPTVNIPRDPNQFVRLQRSDAGVVDFSVVFQGQKQSINQIAPHQYIDGLLVLKGGEILFEKYYGHLTEDRPHLMNSVSKSVVGLVAGKLAAQGVIDLSKPVSEYVPALAKSGYGPDSLQTVLDMRDGSAYSEDYPDFTTTFRIQDCAIGWTDAHYCPKNGPVGLYEFLPTIGRDRAKLGKFSYRSGSTNVIGWVLEEATGQPLAELISEHVWHPMGAEFDANITVDAGGAVLADHGMSSTLRDLGRFGLLMLNNGKAQGIEVIPAAFVQDILNQQGDPAWPYPAPEGSKPNYRSFWWTEGNAGGDVSGYGIHGQFVRVAPKSDVVVVMYSTWPRADGNGETHGWEASAELIDAIITKFH
ncbi:MAG: serine hydrolase [Gammaproteobacteria bacterium]|jgi:CubicO group peptidase (beta-lactamase class C family)|nr:serine hydrolase [Gammaproteobacteria bacterium]